jgi:predicted RecB family nuclease
MRLSASDIHAYYQPDQCDLRLYLRSKGIEESEAGPFELVLRKLGLRHERDHLAALGEHIDLSEGSTADRVAATTAALAARQPVIYQGVLVGELDGLDLIGAPDFLVRSDDGYVIRDSKIARRITEKDHPEIMLQLQLYRHLFDASCDLPLRGLEVHSGTGEIVGLEPGDPEKLRRVLARIAVLKSGSEEPVAAVQWTKCASCSFTRHCWDPAVSRHDVAVVPGVQQKMALALREAGVLAVEDLLQRFDEATLAEFRFPFGNTMRRVGKTAGGVLVLARAIAENKEIVLQPPSLPHHQNYVMLDLEGLPPQLDELEKIYLWGMQVYGERPSEFRPAVAGFGWDGDREGWEMFLDVCEALFADYGDDIPFVHWATYEKTFLTKYVERFGDRDGIAARVGGNCLDLLPITRASVALPLPSYSLKVVEKHVGFTRTLAEGKGDWSIARFIEATETDDEAERATIMKEILAYNAEDLAATWAVLVWLGSRRPVL